MAEPRTKIVICATHRSGSTMLCDDMAATGVLGNAKEYFTRWAGLGPHGDYDRALATMWRDGATANGVFSVKLMSQQLSMVERKLRGVVQPVAGPLPFPHFMRIFQDAVWVSIRRRDVIRQAISHLMAQKTGTFHLVYRRQRNAPGRSATELTKRDTFVSDAELLKEIDRIGRASLAWNAFFALNNISPLELVYEDIATAEPRQYLAGLAARCSIVELPATPQRNLRKLAGEETDAIVERFALGFLKKPPRRNPAFSRLLKRSRSIGLP